MHIDVDHNSIHLSREDPRLLGLVTVVCCKHVFGTQVCVNNVCLCVLMRHTHVSKRKVLVLKGVRQTNKRRKATDSSIMNHDSSTKQVGNSGRPR